MRKLSTLFLVIMVLTTPAFGKMDEKQMMRGAKLEESKAAADTIVIGVNETVGGIAQPGWPIIISAAVVSEEDPAPAVPESLTLQVTDENDAVISMVFGPVQRPAGSDMSQAFWIASAAQNLPSGEYDVGAAPISGFAIEPGILVVETANADNAGMVRLLKIQELLLLGKDDEAMAEADAITASDTEDVDAWVAKGDILMGKDLPDEALKAYEKALEIAEKTDDEPLFIQERHRAALFRSPSLT
jgi:hypothetical protein